MIDETGHRSAVGWIMDRLNSAHGVCVLPGPGRYRLDEPLLPTRGHWSLIGHGGLFATQLVMDPDINASSLHAPHSCRVLMREITFLQDSPVTPLRAQFRQPLVRLAQAYQSVLRDCHFMYGYADGLHFGGAEGGSNNRLDGCHAHKNGRAFVPTDRVCPAMPPGTPGRGIVLENMSNTHVVGGSCEYNMAGGLHILNTRIREDTGAVVEHTRLEGNNQFAMRVDKMARLHVRHSYLYATDMIVGADCEASVREYDNTWGPDATLLDHRGR
jgi:hypothetical protein